MCFWKKNKKIKIEGNKYSVGQCVTFHRRDDLKIGYIYEIHQDASGRILYDVQIGGECPAIISCIPEDKLHLKS